MELMANMLWCDNTQVQWCAHNKFGFTNLSSLADTREMVALSGSVNTKVNSILSEGHLTCTWNSVNVIMAH